MSVIRKRGARLEELEAIYRGRFAEFVRVAAAITRDSEAAADAVHEAFVAAVGKRQQFRGESSLEGWVWRIVVRSSLNRRHDRPALADLPAIPDTALPTTETSDDDAGAVRVLLRDLPERQRIIVFLRYYADLDYATIAEALTVSPGTVASALNSAHSTLRCALSKEVLS